MGKSDDHNLTEYAMLVDIKDHPVQHRAYVDGILFMYQLLNLIISSVCTESTARLYAKGVQTAALLWGSDPLS